MQISYLFPPLRSPVFLLVRLTLYFPFFIVERFELDLESTKRILGEIVQSAKCPFELGVIQVAKKICCGLDMFVSRFVL